MADLTIKIPALQKEFQQPKAWGSWKDSSIATVKKVKTNYGKVLMEASNITGVPLNILVAFTATESGGAKNETLKGSAKGIMQVEVPTAYGILKAQLGIDTLGGFMPFYNVIPSLFKVIKPIPSPLGDASKDPAKNYLQLKLTGTAYPIIIANITKPDAKFAAYIGALTLAQHINATIKSVGQIRLDHIIIKYNAGTGAFSSRVAKKGLEKSNVDTTAIYNSVPRNFATRKAEVVQMYLVKMLGVNGFLDVQKQKLV
jgi:hypothetical protein